MSTRKKIAIIGAGMAGLSAAYDLLAVGHDVTIFEAGSQTGGVASGFRDERWDWSLERFYHHLFQSDKEIIHLVEELGIRDKLFFPRPISSFFYDGRIVPFDSVRAWFQFPAFNFFDTLRFGAVSAFLRYTRLWRLLERTTAERWMRFWYGKKVYNATWRPALINKFGKYYDQVSMGWMWARLYVRSFKLGYFEGGFQVMVDALTDEVSRRGGQIFLNTPIAKIEEMNGCLRISTRTGHSEIFDQCLVTTSPKIMLKLAPSLTAVHEEYAQQLNELKSLGAVVLVAALRWPLMKRTYWLNLPATSPDKTQNELPYLGLFEHTNFIDKKHYGGDHILYMGDYVDEDHPYFSMNEKEITELFLASLPKFNPNFDKDWVRDTWLFRARYAQPIPFVKHSKNIPSIQTPISGLYYASMSQVYPWDRGTNFAVEIGRRAARLMQEHKPA